MDAPAGKPTENSLPNSACEEKVPAILPFEVTSNDIASLNDLQLTSLVQRLLFLEAEVLGLPKAHVDVALNIDAPDGGEDGRLEWTGGPDPTKSDWIPRRLNVFQVKATDMGPTETGNEVQRTVKGADDKVYAALKPRVKDVVDHGGAYILVYGRHCVGQMVDDRIQAIRGKFSSLATPEKAAAVEICVNGAEKMAAWTNQAEKILESLFDISHPKV